MLISFAEELVELEGTRAWNIVFSAAADHAVPFRDTF